MKYLLTSCLVAMSLVSQSQLITDSLLIEHHYRSFSYYKPVVDVNGGSLMFVMHGSGGSGKDMLKHTAKLEAISAKEKLLIVYPEGYLHYWNECRKYATSEANKQDINEQAFFTAMIQYFEQKYHIEKNKVFAAGFSGGGQMAYKLGITMPTQIKAIAAIVANMPDSASCDCVLSGKPLPVLIVNGTLDNTNPFNGGEMFVNNSSYGVVSSTMNSFGYWSALAGYTGSPKVKMLPDIDPSDKKTIEQYSYVSDNKCPVVLLKVIGGHHDYPNDIDVYLYVWNFFNEVQKATPALE
jgi:polyhydroxybutyrate depolymerase